MRPELNFGIVHFQNIEAVEVVMELCNSIIHNQYKQMYVYYIIQQESGANKCVRTKPLVIAFYC